MNIKKNIRIALMGLAALAFMAPMASCTDEPDAENYYTFTGEMLSDYLNNRPEYSEFKTICERAKLMDLLATYGQYTCFLPSNEAVQNFLKERGLSSLDQLSDADCDTIARTHLVANMYSTFEMTQDRLATANLLGRYLATSQGVDNDSNAVVYLEGVAHIYFEKTLADGTVVHQNDSVENGIVQPIDMVIEKSNSYIADILRDNPKISIFYSALQTTGVKEQILLVDDPNYNKRDYPLYRYKSHVRNEVAWVPDTKKYGFTVFVEPDSVYQAKFQEYGISTANGQLRALYDLACQIYDPVYPEDVSAEGHKFENLTDSVNPLRRFVQYHIMTRYVPGTSDLTALIVPETKEAFGFETKWLNAIDWYETLLPHKMLKIEQLSRNKREDTKNDCIGIDGDKKERHFINRRYEAPEYEFRGACVDNTVETKPVHDALNGHYFYVDDLVVFSKDVRDRVQNMRIRMDFSTVFPEVMTNDMRLKGNYRADDGYNAPADDSPEPKNGKNHYFPLGYLDGVTFNSNCTFVYRRPHWEFWSWQGDEWNLFGDYDFTFRIPPVPYSGEWQLRLGFAPLETRGVMQVYFDGVPQGIPLDMTQILTSEMYLGDRFTEDPQLSEYKKTAKEDLAEEQKLLKNLNAYRGPRSCYNISNNGTQKNYSWGISHMMRRVLCQTYIDATKDHYLRFRVASDGKQGNDNEFMLDFFEMCPKSVYGVDGDGEMEDDL
jgi:uncharacterized surface protein with fasciclin (FAS1) repeats